MRDEGRRREEGGPGLPGERTARHSLSVRWSGYDMLLLAGVELKNELKNGIDGIERRGVTLAGC